MEQVTNIVYNGDRAVNIGDVFYRIEGHCVGRYGSHECVYVYEVRRWRICEISQKMMADTWAGKKDIYTYVTLYKKTGRGSYDTAFDKTFMDCFLGNLNCTDPGEAFSYISRTIYFDDYNLACSIAKRLNDEQKQMLEKYNKDNGTNLSFNLTTKNDKCSD